MPGERRGTGATTNDGNSDKEMKGEREGGPALNEVHTVRISVRVTPSKATETITVLAGPHR